MESNGGGAGGGALSLDGVRDATIIKSVFFNNSVAGLTDAGGAVMAKESTVKFAGVQFSQNVAAHGNGGAVAIFSGEVSWSLDAETCSRTDVVVDLTTTTEHCGQYIPDVMNTCESGECATANYVNPYMTDRSVLKCNRRLRRVVCLEELLEGHPQPAEETLIQKVPVARAGSSWSGTSF